MKGSVRKRGSTYTYLFKIKIDGKYKQISKGGFKTKKEANAALTEALSLYNNTKQVQTNSNITLGEYIDYWFETVATPSLKHNSLDLYKRQIKLHIKPHLGFVKVSELNPMLLQNFFTDKQKTLSNSSINAMRNVLNGTLKLALKQNVILINPMKQIELKSKKSEKNKTAYTTEEELELIMNDIKDTRYYIPFLIALHTGARRGEVLALTWSDIDFDSKTISFNKSLLAVDGKPVQLSSTKTNSSNRCILMTNKLVQELAIWKEKQDSNKAYYEENYYTDYDFICTNEDGTPINPKRFSTQVSRMSKRLNINFTFHDLRHTHATRLILSDVNIKVIQERLGHSDITTTLNVYSHVTPQLEQDSIDKLENKFK